MSEMIKILHVDPDFKVTYFIYGPGSSIRTPVPLETAIDLLKKVDFDLILSEPHNKAILKKKIPKMEPSGSNLMLNLLLWRPTMAISGKYGPIDIPKSGSGNPSLFSGLRICWPERPSNV